MLIAPNFCLGIAIKQPLAGPFFGNALIDMAIGIENQLFPHPCGLAMSAITFTSTPFSIARVMNIRRNDLWVIAR
jgi:hypothetical protein